LQRLRAEAEFEAYESEEVNLDESYDTDDDGDDVSLESSDEEKDLGTPV